MTTEGGAATEAEAAILDASHFFDITVRKPARASIEGVTLGKRR